jgi:hypothetical protein
MSFTFSRIQDMDPDASIGRELMTSPSVYCFDDQDVKASGEHRIMSTFYNEEYESAERRLNILLLGFT